jgi:hypothetical protein
MSDPWLELGPTTYQADGFTQLQFPARLVGEDGGLRVVERVRPWQAGAKLDETGAMPDRFTIESVIHNDIIEQGLEGVPVWPGLIEDLIEQFKSGKTGTLNLPWKRGLRVKPETWSRRANADEHRGGESFVVNFKQDNEDNLDREAFERVSVKAGAARVVDEAIFSMESEGMSADPIGDLTELAANLVGLLNTPSDYAQAILTQARRLRRAGKILIGEYQAESEGRDQMNSPAGFAARLKLLELLELAARAESDAREFLPRTRSYIAPRRTDIWTIATELGQDARQLMAVNSAVEDFSNIEQGTAVQVFAE